eukprot:3348581-Rhodomonas_salina.2
MPPRSHGNIPSSVTYISLEDQNIPRTGYSSANNRDDYENWRNQLHGNTSPLPAQKGYPTQTHPMPVTKDWEAALRQVGFLSDLIATRSFFTPVIRGGLTDSYA